MEKKFAAVIQVTEYDFLQINNIYNFPNVVPIIKKSGLFQNIILAVGTNKKNLPKNN